MSSCLLLEFLLSVSLVSLRLITVRAGLFVVALSVFNASYTSTPSKPAWCMATICMM